MSKITKVRIEYRDDCEQTITLNGSLRESSAVTIGCMVLSMRNGYTSTPIRIEFLDDSGEIVRSFEKRIAGKTEGDAS